MSMHMKSGQQKLKTREGEIMLNNYKNWKRSQGTLNIKSPSTHITGVFNIKERKWWQKTIIFKIVAKMFHT